MKKTVQEEIRPRLSRVEGRSQELKSLSEVVGRLTPGAAIALLGPPGVDLRRLAHDVIRGLPEPTLMVWIDLAELSDRVARSLDPDPAAPGATWDQVLEMAFAAGFEDAYKSEGIPLTELEASEEERPDDQTSTRIQRFALLTRRQRRGPVLVLLAMHRLPWAVSERLQNTLRKVVDYADRQQILRLALTSASDFLSGEAIVEGGGEFGTSPLYARTTRYEVVPFNTEQLWELSPLPAGLPDRLIEVLVRVTGGSVGLLELLFQAILADPRLGRWLLDAHPEGGDDPPSWFWPWMAQAEPLARPARQLIREGLGALLSSPKGRSRPTVEALQELLDGGTPEEASADVLLPLEVGGLTRVTYTNGWYRYTFISPLIPPLLVSVLPDGKHLRDRLDAFARSFTWNEPFLETAPPPAPPQVPSVRTTGAGARIHVTANRPEPLPTPPACPLPPATEVGPAPPVNSGPGPSPAREPLRLPEEVRQLIRERSPEAARRLLELILAITRAVTFARREGRSTPLTPAQLELRWIPLDAATLGMLASEPPVPPPFSASAPGRWEVHFSTRADEGVHWLEAAALFMPPERLPALLQGATGAQPFVSAPSDDAFAIGQFIGLLVASEPDPRRVIEQLQARLVNAQTLGVGPLVRLVKRCLDPNPERRPDLLTITSSLEHVLADPYRVARRLVRYFTLAAFVLVVVLGLVDFAFDAQVDNPEVVYTGLKVVGAAAWGAFYLLSYIFLGHRDKERIHQQLLSFVLQRMNRVRWMVGPALIAVAFCLLFGHRLYYSRGVHLSLFTDHTIEEVRLRTPGESLCSSFHRYSSSPASATLRLSLVEAEYSFILLQKTPQGVMRREYLWPAEQVAAFKAQGWWETLEVYHLKPPPEGRSCLPPAPPTIAAPP